MITKAVCENMTFASTCVCVFETLAGQRLHNRMKKKRFFIILCYIIFIGIVLGFFCLSSLS